MKILVGPAGWSYPDWRGRVYPDPLPRGFDALGYLATYFPVIEINSTFYRPAAARTAEGWARRTPDEFHFTAKIWEKFTHGNEGWGSADVRSFQEGLLPLVRAGKLRVLLLQFPWFFQDGAEARDRVRAIVDAFREWAPMVVEVRHRSWREAIDFFRELGVGLCGVDHPRSATPMTGAREVIGRVAYVRFHGRNARAWFSKGAGRDEKYDYLYSEDELRPWVESLRSMSEAADSLYVIMNNHFQGKAIVNAIQLRRLLGETVEEFPETLRRCYPQLGVNSW